MYIIQESETVEAGSHENGFKIKNKWVDSPDYGINENSTDIKRKFLEKFHGQEIKNDKKWVDWLWKEYNRCMNIIDTSNKSVKLKSVKKDYYEAQIHK